VPWSFLLFFAPFLSLLLPYKKVRKSQKWCQSTAKASDYVKQKQVLARVNIIMKHAPIYNRDDSLDHQLRNEQINFECFLIVIFDNSCFAM